MGHNLFIKNANSFVHGPNGLELSTVHILVESGKIKQISSNEINVGSDFPILDAKGLHVLPGVIDSQVHFREPGLTHKEDLETGTRGALLGGVTSIFEMPNTIPATTTQELFEDKLHRAKDRCHVNYAFFIGGSAENAEKLAELEKNKNCSGIKVFMGSSTGTLLVEDDETLEKILRSGQRLVIVHSEDEPRLKERKKTILTSNDPKLHPLWRDVETALKSTKRLVALAEKTKRPVHVLHVTSAEEMDFLKNKKNVVSVEVLPQHLTLFAPDCYEKLGTYAQQNPPIREKRHLDRLWQAINDGTVDVLGSDHAPHTKEEKNREYPNTPSGMPGVQTLVPIMLNHVNNGKLSLQRFVELTSENQRRVFKIKNKGRIEVGHDGDFTIVDLKKKMTIENSWIASRSGWTPFDGMQVQGWPVMTILNGQICMQEGRITAAHQGKPVEFDY